jgi:hypothetical protein
MKGPFCPWNWKKKIKEEFKGDFVFFKDQLIIKRLFGFFFVFATFF